MGDWVLAAPDGTVWALSVLEGSYECIADSTADFDRAKLDFAWLDHHFCAAWQEIAHRNDVVPSNSECLTWKVPPVLSGTFNVEDLCTMPLDAYQHAMSQLHQQLRERDSERI
jgi:hypothetical protein